MSRILNVLVVDMATGKVVVDFKDSKNPIPDDKVVPGGTGFTFAGYSIKVSAIEEKTSTVKKRDLETKEQGVKKDEPGKQSKDRQ